MDILIYIEKIINGNSSIPGYIINHTF